MQPKSKSTSSTRFEPYQKELFRCIETNDTEGIQKAVGAACKVMTFNFRKNFDDISNSRVEKFLASNNKDDQRQGRFLEHLNQTPKTFIDGVNLLHYTSQFMFKESQKRVAPYLKGGQHADWKSNQVRIVSVNVTSLKFCDFRSFEK